MKKLLPIGIQTFRKIREENYLYVDKTKQIYDLITTGTTYFLSRPRRFGKSLLISTLEAIFKGEKKLFQGLDIERMDYDWQIYPVIRISFGGNLYENRQVIEKYLIESLEGIAQNDTVKLQKKEFPSMLRELIKALAKKNRVVVLIDEYDKPLIDNLTNQSIYKENREMLKAFYSIFKEMDEYLKFVFLTGVSKFSKVGVFSGLNNLEDITMDEHYSGLLGWTQKELESNFQTQIKSLAQREEETEQKIIKKIKYWYNGYRFSAKKLYVYNPFSTLLLFKQKSFKFHWFETGTPTFLIELMKKQNTFSLKEMVDNQVSEEAFSSYEIENLEVLPLLFQTGYLTIKEVNKTPDEMLYKLDYPNFEVKRALVMNLLGSYAHVDKTLSRSYLEKLICSLDQNNLGNFFETLRIFFANIPYTIQLKQEKYYQTIFYLIFSLLGLRVQAEVTTNRGRIDAVIELKKSVYIFEFKLFGTPQEALAQIKEKQYYEKYLDLEKKITLVGVAFDSEERNIGEHIEATVDCDQKDKPQ